MFYKPDCLHFLGHIPCKPHKQHGYHCTDCPAYTPIEKRILIIKLGAIGDVIRTTPLVTRYKKMYPGAKFTWITLSPDILPKNEIHEILKLNTETVLYVQNTDWDIAINLDKEKEAGALLKTVNATEKLGFILKNGAIQPVNGLADHKFHTGLFDDVSKSNTKNYCTEIFELCGMQYDGEPYLLDNHANDGYTWELSHNTPILGFNTGCGDRWTTRLWSIEKWVELAQKAMEAGYQVLLLGGKQEHERNLQIQAASGAMYLGHFPLPQFINLIDQCNLVVTQVTMGMHLTLGLQKKIVLINNIFNPHEFDLFGNGRIIEPPKPCKCYYRGTCVDGISCMETLESASVMQAVQEVMAS
ncbi:MAG: glycosyltransferase family 9 protein [Bacteroidetes bacterium]|nr:glycosyltransferase family 9 protein [Bacteroidota bacterium]